MRGEIPSIPSDVRVPFSKAAIRREGSDVTIVSWGRAVHTSLDAAARLAEEGVDAEVIDLRTLVPPDLDTVMASCEKTGRLVVAAEDRSFAGFVRSIQGPVVEQFPGMPTIALGQKNIPGIAQSLILEDATILTQQDIVDGAKKVLSTKVSGDDRVVHPAAVLHQLEPQAQRKKGWRFTPAFLVWPCTGTAPGKSQSPPGKNHPAGPKTDGVKVANENPSGSTSEVCATLQLVNHIVVACLS